MRKLLFIFILLFVSNLTLAQDPEVELKLLIKNDAGKNFAGVTVVILKDGSSYKTETTDSKGRIKTPFLPVGSVYRVTFKKDGYVTKVVEFDAHYDTPEDLNPFILVEFRVSLFEEVEGADFSFLKSQPVAKYEFTSDGYAMDYDFDHSKNIGKQVAELRKKAAKLAAELAAKKLKFDELMAEGDRSLSKEKYQEAVKQYTAALNLFNDDATAKSKQAEAQQKLDALNASAQKDKDYNAKTAEARKAFENGDLEGAKSLYQDAKTIKPTETLPDTEIAKIDKLIADQKANSAKFDKLVADGDAAMSNKSYDDAITKYTDALKIKAKDSDVTSKLANAKKLKSEAENAANAEAQKEADYQAIIKSANKLFVDKNWDGAIQKYNAALNVKENDPFATGRIKEINSEIAKSKAKEEALKKKEKEYLAKMTEAKNAFDAKKYDQSKTLYQAAQKIDEAKSEPATEITKIENLLKGQADKKAKFDQLVAEGNTALTTQLFDDALLKYNAALKEIEDDVIKQKIIDVTKLRDDKLAAEQAEKNKEAEYLILKNEADKLFSTAEWESAKGKYNEALLVKENDTYSIAKIAEIDKELAAAKADKEATEKLEKAYTDLISEADKLYESNSYEEAKTKYLSALEIKKGEQHPISRIADIEKKLISQANEKKIDQEYQAEMTIAESLFEAKEYEKAIASYQKASGIKKDEQKPKDQIEVINELLNAQKNADQLEAEYQSLMKDGDTYLAAKNLQPALTSYKNALGKKPNDVNATNKITEVEAKIKAEKDAAQLDKDFDGFVKNGKDAFVTKDYIEAKMNYNKALDLKEDADLRQKIIDIDKLIAENQSQSELKEKFDLAMAIAKEEFDAKSYQKAIDKYTEANSIKSSQLALDQIALAKQKLNELEAQENKEAAYNDLITKAKEYESNNKDQLALDTYKTAYIQKQESEIQDKIKALQAKIDLENTNKSKSEAYQAKIELADGKMVEEDWLQAIEYYNQAKEFTDDESYITTKIAEAKKELQNTKDSKLREEYNKLISSADEYYKGNKYEEALIDYKKAKGYQIADDYPSNQIALINKAKQDKINALNDADKEEQAYLELVKSADDDVTVRSYTDALDKYKQAITKKPTDTDVLEKINQVKQLIETQNINNAKDADYNKILAEADELRDSKQWKEAILKYESAIPLKNTDPYPHSQIEFCKSSMKAESSSESEKAYQKLLSVAQKKMDEKDYTKAINLYERAITLKSGDPLPPARINEINQLILKDKNDGEYNDLVARADNLYEKQKWKEALPLYEKAYGMRNEDWVDQKIQEIRGKTTENEQRQYKKMIGKADEYFTASNYSKSKGLYERAIKLFSQFDNTYPKARLIEINDILHPPTLVKTNTVDRGKPVVGMSDEQMLAELIKAQDTRKGMEDTKVVELRDEVITNKRNWGEAEVIANDVVRKNNIKTSTEIESKNIDAEKARLIAEKTVLDQEDEITKKTSGHVTYQDNVVFRQKRVVENSKAEIAEANYNADLGRVEVEAIVINQKTEISTENRLNQNAQNSNVFETKKYVEKVKSEHVTKDPTNDVPRKNMEVYVVDQQQDINKQAKGNYDHQEDVIMNTKVELNKDLAEQKEAFLQSDVPREQMEIVVVESTESISDKNEVMTRKQSDVNYENKKYIEYVQEEIRVANMTNDVPRQKMEIVIVESNQEISDVKSEFTSSQNIANANTKDVLKDHLKEQQDIKYQKYKDNIDNEDVVFAEREKVKATKSALAIENTNSSYSTKDFVEEKKKENTAIDVIGNQNVKNNQDKIKNKIEENKNSSLDLNKKNQESQNNNLDQIKETKSENIKKDKGHIKNKMGIDYPEGVTEEIFERKDKNGLLLSYTVRRYVVVQEEGHVYEKTRSRTGVSFTKNGKSITEFQWQSDTASANLVRHK